MSWCLAAWAASAPAPVAPPKADPAVEAGPALGVDPPEDSVLVVVVVVVVVVVPVLVLVVDVVVVLVLVLVLGVVVVVLAGVESPAQEAS